MKNIFTILFVVLFISNENFSQVVTGKLVDENGAGLVEVQLQLYAAPNVYNATSSSDGTFSFDIISGIEDDHLPYGYSVSNNFPNPFNPSTVISYQLPVGCKVILKVFDVLAKEIATLVNEEKPAGSYEIEFDPASLSLQLASGIYYYQLRVGDYIETKKMILLK